MYVIKDSLDDQYFGPYTKKPLVDKVLKFVQQAIDPEAEVVSQEADEFEKEIMAGLLPIKISVEIFGNTPQEPTVEISWPPRKEGIIMNTDNYREYFFWAKNRTEALLKLVRTKPPKPEPEPEPGGRIEERTSDMLEEMMQA